MCAAKVDQLSQEGFGHGKSEKYEASRPGYDPQVLSLIRTLVSKEDGINVVEIGCGTGIFTRGLLNHPEWSSSVSALHAVDPNEGMRKVFAQAVTDPRVTLVDGVFEKTGAGDGWADVIVMAAAFHWCLDYEAALTEFSRILKPGGVAVIVSAGVDEEQNLPYLQEVRDLSNSYNPRHTDGSTPLHDRWREAFKAPSYSTLFQDPQEDVVKTSMTVTVDWSIAFFSTISFIAIQSKDEKKVIEAKVREILERGEGVHWVDKEKATFRTPVRTLVVSMRKK